MKRRFRRYGLAALFLCQGLGLSGFRRPESSVGKPSNPEPKFPLLGDVVDLDAVTEELLGELDKLRTSTSPSPLGVMDPRDLIDPALGGRLARSIQFRLPGPAEAERLLRYYVRKKRISLDIDVDLRAVASEAQGLSSAQLKQLVDEAGSQMACRWASSVNADDFREALEVLQMGPVQAEEARRRRREEAMNELAERFRHQATALPGEGIETAVERFRLQW